MGEVGNTADANTHVTSLDGEEHANARCRVDDEAFKKPYVHWDWTFPLKYKKSYQETNQEIKKTFGAFSER